MATSVLDYLEATADQFQNKTAFISPKEQVTFLELMDNAKRIGSFIAKNTTPKKPVVVYMDKGVSCINAYLGAVYAGCFYVPIDSKMPVERVTLILTTLKPTVIIYDESTVSTCEQLDVNCSKICYIKTLENEADKSLLEKIRKQIKSTDLLYVLFTSGSTGLPKGVTISHLAVIDFVEWICNKFNFTENNSMCNQAPLYFDASVPDLYIPLKTGATTYIPPKMYYTFPKMILAYIEKNHINTLIWVPSALCNVVNCNALSLCSPESAKLVIFCGEVMPCKHLNVLRNHLKNATFVNMYGPTEATYACMYYVVDRKFKDDEVLPMGSACENTEILLLDSEEKPVSAVGEKGEICILGQCLSNGYYALPQKTKEAFIQNPVNSYFNEMMYKTGDLAYYDDNGNLIFAGRKDHQIKRLGHRIELGEIENSILSAEGVENACCIFDEKKNEIIAVYTGNVAESFIKNELNLKLPAYMLPNLIKNIQSMPMNINGKIDRIALRKEFTGK